MNTTQTIAPSKYEWTVPGCGTFLGREIGRCRSCKTVTIRETRFHSGSKITCGCGERVQLKGMWGTESTKECNDKCMGAVGPSCECSCGGRNHGGRHW